jgi:xanthine dehydrogenase accessory factor
MTPLAPRLREMLAQNERCAMVSIAGARGSTPRELGARMLVGRDRIAGTIGGGRLEYDAMRQARALLARGGGHALEEVPLGPALGQCCGGHASVLIEAVDEGALEWLEPLDQGAPGVLLTPLDHPSGRRLVREPRTEALPELLKEAAVDALMRRETAKVSLPGGATWLIEPLERGLPQVLLFGAGHVGRALATALSPLPCRVRWIDDRAELLALPPEGAEVIPTRHPQDRVGEAPAGSFFLVMTHSHDLDCELCEAVLRRGDFAFLGLIGSASKRARFERRWRARGVAEAQIARLVCPIGLPGIAGKQPAVIAAATAAQLLMAFEAAQLGSRPVMPST